MSAPLVIVGTGLAGYTLAREWRRLDASTPLLIITRDAGGFYSKPRLSNALAGGKTPQSLVMKPAAQMAQDLNADIRTHARVEAIDTDARTLAWTDASGSLHTTPWRDLVLALGADPIRLPLAGDAADRVRSVNDLDDFATFLQELGDARRVAILGAGLIGCEFANDLLARGIQPTVIDPAGWPLGRLLPNEAGAHIRGKLEAAGVSFIFQASVERVDASGAGLKLGLTDGSLMEVDAVLSAVGLRPRTALAQAAGVVTGRGIITDRHLRTSADGVHALGDCVEVQHQGLGHVLPYVMPIMQQARALAATLAGTPTAVAYPAMPVTVKTPACPTVVCPPPSTATVTWTVERDDQGCTALAHAAVPEGSAPEATAPGAVLGFALLGAATARKQELARAVAPVMGD